MAGAGCRSRYVTGSIFIDTEVGKEEDDNDDEDKHCDCSHGDNESAPAPEQSMLSTQGSVQLTHRDGSGANAGGAAEAEAEEQRFTIHRLPSQSISVEGMFVVVAAVVSTSIMRSTATASRQKTSVSTT